MTEAAPLEKRPYAPGDEHATLELFKEAFGRELPLSFWRWRFLDNPAGGPWVEGAFDGDRMVSHYAATATRLCVGGEMVPAGLSMMTMTHPGYQGRGLFVSLGRALYARMKEAELALAFGFPNANVHRSRRRALAWEDIYEVPTLTVDIANARLRSVRSDIEPVDRFDDRFDRLWDRIKDRRRIWTWRDAAYLNWRFIDHPTNTYDVLAMVDGEEVRGYAVYKRYLDQVMDIVDVVGETDKIVSSLYEAVCARARDEGVSRAVTWMLPKLSARPNLESIGFQLAEPITYLGGVGLLPLSADPIDWRNWDIQMSDSDVY